MSLKCDTKATFHLSILLSTVLAYDQRYICMSKRSGEVIDAERSAVQKGPNAI
jgi:hypothetical protein